MDLDYSDYSDLNYTQLAFPGFHQQLQNGLLIIRPDPVSHVTRRCPRAPAVCLMGDILNLKRNAIYPLVI